MSSSSPLGALVQELRRRRVIRGATIYAVVAWGVMQVADTFFPALHLPDWTVTLVAALLVLGFPVTLVLTWLFDLTPEGVRRSPAAGESPDPAPAAAGGRARSWSMIAGGLAVVTMIGYGGYRRVADPPGPQPGAHELRSVAVLPFMNMSDDKENEYFSDGITEELLNVLAKVPELRVAARTSAFAYKGKNVDIREIGKRLGVQTVVEGSVRKSGDKVRITAQLIEAETGYHLWSETYDRELRDIFAVQDEISQAIAQALQLELAGGTAGRPSHGTLNVEAYDLYLKGRYALRNEADTEPGARRAVELLEGAVRHDPAYALAHAELAEAYMHLADFVGSEGVINQAREAALKAIQFGEALPETHTAMAHVRMHHEWNLPETEREYRRALELDPRSPDAHANYAHYLTATRRYAEALDATRRAIALRREQPGDQTARTIAEATALGHALYYAGQHEAAIREAQRALALNPHATRAQHLLAVSYLGAGAYDRAIEILEKMHHAHGDHTSPNALLGYAYARSGRAADARRVLAKLDRRGAGSYVSPVDLALIHVGLGDHRRAVDLLEEGYRLRAPQMPHIWGNPLFDPLHSDQRFMALMRRLGMPGVE